MKTFEEEKEELIKNAERFGDAAFPVTLEQQYTTKENIKFVTTTKGLSKREYFAALAMQGILANSECLQLAKRIQETHEMYILTITSASIKYADALIAELNKK